jgi:16S rRNA (guanine527-N7)-methyltransferase
MDTDQTAAVRLNDLLASAGLATLNIDLSGRFQAYVKLLMRWNARLNLTAVRDEDGILSRHFVESIACARSVPAGVTSLLDFGSGAGFPGIPIALCRPEIGVTLAESQSKKAAFLQEAVRTLALQASVHSGRAETLKAVFDCVAMRAVDRMEEAVNAGSKLVAPNGWLVLMTTEPERARQQLVAGHDFEWIRPVLLPSSENRLIAMGKRGK